MILRGRRRDAGGKGLARDVEELPRLRIDVAYGHCRSRVGVVAVEPHSNVDRDDVTLLDDALFRRDPVDDLLVDRRADAGGEVVKTLERRHRPRMAPDEILGDLVQLQRRHPWPDAPLEQMNGRREYLAAARHYLDLALRLDLDHGSSAFTARLVTSSTEPSASTLSTFWPCSSYHSMTGSV